ncbi:MAG: nucleotidyltransferase domain-containing protein [Candidatus Muiribacteriota bacterium]|jgi:predicted nucleotidyltransferase
MNVNSGLRLSEYEISTIKNTILNFDDNAEIYIFGSRTDISKKGGDIDIFVESNITKSNLLDFKLKVLTELEIKLGERKIDLVVKPSDFDEIIPIYEIAKTQGVKL